MLFSEWRQRQLIGSNPLVRVQDRTETRLVVALLAVAVLMIPVFAAFGSTLMTARVAEVERQQADRVKVSAVLTQDAPASRADPVRPGLHLAEQAEVPARWSAPGGASRSGTVLVNHGVKAGQLVDIWVDRDGTPVSAPLLGEQAKTSAVAVTIGMWLAFCAVLAAIFLFVRRRLNRIRDAAWDREWARIGRIET